MYSWGVLVWGGWEWVFNFLPSAVDEVGIISSILAIRTLRMWTLKCLARGHRAYRWPSQGFDLQGSRANMLRCYKLIPCETLHSFRPVPKSLSVLHSLLARTSLCPTAWRNKVLMGRSGIFSFPCSRATPLTQPLAPVVDWIVFPPNSHITALNPNVTIFGDGPLKRQ